MLDNHAVFETAKQVIGVVDDARENAPLRGVHGNYYTLEGAVAEVLNRNLDAPMDRLVRHAVDRARYEETQLRLGCLDPRDLRGGSYEEDSEASAGELLSESLQRLFEHAARELAGLRSHGCEFGEDDYCAICGLDGRA